MEQDGMEKEPPDFAIKMAIEVSTWSPCRSKRGVIIWGDAGIIASGYNYKPRGFDCDGSEACKATCRNEAIHAEQQALLAAGHRARGANVLHVKTVKGLLVPSGGPSCVQCSKLLLVSGVNGVWLYHEDGWRVYERDKFHNLSLAEAASRVTALEEENRQLRGRLGL